jgi:hypothetical protein
MAKGKKTGGRRPGSQNKLTTALKDMILQALSDVGGVEYLKDAATAQPVAFLSLIGRVLPLQVKDGGDEPRVPTTVVMEIHDKPPQV